MLLIGKKVPARNIIGKVTMLPMTPAVSGFLVTVPTSIPSAAKSIGPKIRKGSSQMDRCHVGSEGEDANSDHQQETSEAQEDVEEYF